MKIHPLSILAGVIIGGVASFLLISSDNESSGSEDTNKPLYWVAPMDPNFRRDQPGKSPMGMDLVPVYAESDGEDSPGVISLSPEIIHNIGVKTSPALRMHLNQNLKTMGVVTFDEDLMVHIHPRMEGWIEKLHVKSEGEMIEANQPLYDIYSPALVNAQEELVLALKRNNKALVQASTQRLKSLHVPESTIEFIKTNKKIQNSVTYTAPQSGVINNLMIREGMYVKPSTTMMSLAQIDAVWVEAEILAAQSEQLIVGANLTLNSNFNSQQVWKGTVDYIYPTLDPKNRTLKFRSSIINPDQQLKPNMFVSVNIEDSSFDEVLAVPIQSVIQTGEQDRVVLAMGEGRFKSIQVELGRQGNNHMEILSGLKEGDEIVSSAQFLLDSESSPSSDFKRMSHALKPDSSATVTGIIESIDMENQQLQVLRGEIKKWSRPPASVMFAVDEHINLKNLQIEDKIKFSFIIKDGNFIIVDIEAINSAKNVPS